MIVLNSEESPWGRFFVLQDEPNYKLKRIKVVPRGSISYQYHFIRSELWIIAEGADIITLDVVDKEYSMGQTISIPRGIKHRIENRSDHKLVFIEFQKGSYFGEDDFVRIEDDYNRL